MKITQNDNGPAILSPLGDNTVSSLIDYLQGSVPDWLKLLHTQGAFFLRGFEIDSPTDFQKVASTIHPDLKDDYLGTSPRDKVKGTDYVFTASELPPFYPIMQHCEMSFLPHPPAMLFFYCDIPSKVGGATPTCDFSKVYDQMDASIRSEFENKGVISIRNYSGIDDKSFFNFTQLKRWDQMFLTADRKMVEEKCKEWDIKCEWYGNGKLRLSNHTPAIQIHPVSKKKIWYNHTQVFHVDAPPMEYSHIRKVQAHPGVARYHWLSDLMVTIKKWNTKPLDHAMNMLFGDGSEIPSGYVRHIQEVIWKNISIIPWQKGDVLVIDNKRTSHGRLPYSGPRSILVSWSSSQHLA